jgi:small subunit ribosomal protein S17
MSGNENMSEQSIERADRKVREGLVVSDKMDKTVVVEVEDRVKHRLYGKVLRRTSKLKAHDEANSAGASSRSSRRPSNPIRSARLHSENQRDNQELT